MVLEQSFKVYISSEVNVSTRAGGIYFASISLPGNAISQTINRSSIGNFEKSVKLVSGVGGLFRSEGMRSGEGWVLEDIVKVVMMDVGGVCASAQFSSMFEYGCLIKISES